MASDWCWSISCFSRRPHKKGSVRQEGLCFGRAGRLRRARQQHSQNPAGEWCTPSSALLLPSSVCENLYQSRCACTAPAHGFTSGLFHRHGSGGVAARHVSTLVATCCWWEKSYQRHYYTIAEKAPARLPSVLFLKFLFLIICQQTRPRKRYHEKKEIEKKFPEELSCSVRMCGVLMALLYLVSRGLTYD